MIIGYDTASNHICVLVQNITVRDVWEAAVKISGDAYAQYLDHRGCSGSYIFSSSCDGLQPRPALWCKRSFVVGMYLPTQPQPVGAPR